MMSILFKYYNVENTKMKYKSMRDHAHYVVEDGVLLLSSRYKKLKNSQNYPEVFKSATKQALEDFRGKKIKIGRARMFEDKTKDLDDPGMYALYKLTKVFYEFKF